MKKIILAVFVLASTIGTRAQTSWDLTGNSATTPGTHFIGTSDTQNLVFKRNSVHAGFLGTANTSFGLSALNPAGTGGQNTAFGITSLYSNAGGGNNVAFGFKSLYSNSGGNYNVGIGVSTLYTNSSGSNSTAVGLQALYFNSTGSHNTATGRRALYSNTIGNFNSAQGSGALYSNTTGGSNTAGGVDALYSNLGGTLNSAYGSTALFSNQSGTRNTANGYHALYNNISGDFNTGSGADALYNSTGIINTGFGYKAGYTLVDGIYNTFFGYNSGSGIVHGDSNTILGPTSTTVPLGDISNSVVVSDGAGNIRVFIDSVGRTGIGTSSPNANAKLDVRGNIYCNNKVFIGVADAYTTTQIGDYSLAVKGTAIFNKAKVKIYTTTGTGGWADYVFNNDYKLLSLPDLEKYIKTNKHLPEVSTTAEVERDGIDLGDTQTILLKKIEELTLYVIDLNKKLIEQQHEINNLKRK